MILDNVSDVIISIADKFDSRELECKFDFIYNNYDVKETLVDDNIISNRETNFNKDRFIRVSLEHPKSTAIAKESDSFMQIFEKFLSYFSDRNLYEEDRNFFNKMDILSPSKISLIHDNKIDDLKNFLKLYSGNNSDFDENDFAGLDRSRKISFEMDMSYEDTYNTKEYIEGFNAENIKSYLELVSNEEVYNARKNKEDSAEKFKSGVLLPNLKTISKSINFGDVQDYIDKNALFCGLYVEKFCKKEDKYEFKCAKFIQRDAASKGIFNKTLEDEAIRYGETYRYVCHYVYHFMCLNEEDRFMLDHFLLCTEPYISNDVVCKEFDSPPPPTGVSAEYDKLVGKLFLKWRHPTNYENDVKGYQVLKRNSLEEPFVLTHQLEGHLQTDAYELSELVAVDSIFKTPGYIPDYLEDETYDKNKLCIYTVRSIDAHGMLSNYSEQIAVYYDFLRDKLIVDSVATQGSRVDYPNETVRNKSIFFENKVDVVDNLPIVENPKKISVYVTPDYGTVLSGDGDEKVFPQEDNIEYQFTFSNLNSLVYRSDKFTVRNFG
jgi:hypothetical protein